MGLLYKIYQTLQEGHEREADATDDRSGMEDEASAADFPVSLAQLLANPVGGESGEQS